MHEFKAAFTENLRISVYVSMHYRDSETAERVVRSFLLLFGQVPTVLKVGVSAIIVHPGDAFWAGGQKRTLVFHAARFDEHYASGHAEELIFHEATHASLEPGQWNSPEWRAAQNRDREFISSYAQRFPDREDFAESFLRKLCREHSELTGLCTI